MSHLHGDPTTLEKVKCIMCLVCPYDLSWHLMSNGVLEGGWDQKRNRMVVVKEWTKCACPPSQQRLRRQTVRPCQLPLPCSPLDDQLGRGTERLPPSSFSSSIFNITIACACPKRVCIGLAGYRVCIIVPHVFYFMLIWYLCAKLSYACLNTCWCLITDEACNDALLEGDRLTNLFSPAHPVWWD